NCIAFQNPGDGIRIQDSADVVVFNNLIFRNDGDGLGIAGTITGSRDALVVNNTIALNAQRGIVVGSTRASSPGAFLRNNVVNNNGADSPDPLNILVRTDPSSDLGLSADFDLVSPDLYRPASAQGPHDIN